MSQNHGSIRDTASRLSGHSSTNPDFNAHRGLDLLRGSDDDTRSQLSHESTESSIKTGSESPERDPSLLLPRESLMQELREKFSKKFSSKTKRRSWQRAAEIVEKHSEAMVERWVTEIDALPTFAGLFAAALTAFNVESYKLLQPAQTDPSSLILAQISAQLASFSISQTFANSTQPAFTTAPSTPLSPPAPLYAIVLNVLWFSSLVLSLASGAIGIVVKQWLSEYHIGLSGTSREIAHRRQYRLNNLSTWQVGFIVSTLPILLHAAFVLFLAGLLVFLGTIHPIVAAVVAVPIAIVLAFIGATTILPAVWPSCCYYSAQAYVVFWIREQMKKLFKLLLLRIVFPLLLLLVQVARRASSQAGIARNWLSFLSVRLDILLFRSIWRRGEETFIIRDGSMGRLDVDLMTMAYSTSLNLKCFEAAEANLPDVDGESLARFALHAYAVLDNHWGAWWPNDTFHQYTQLAIRAMEHCLITTQPDRWKHVQKWIMRTMTKTLIPPGPDLLRYKGRPSDYYMTQSEPAYDAIIITLPEEQFIEFLRCMAIVSMAPKHDNYSHSKSAEDSAWEVFLSGVQKRWDLLDWAQYRFVIAAAIDKFTRCKRQLKHSTSASHTPTSLGAVLGHRKTLNTCFDALHVATRCFTSGRRVLHDTFYDDVGIVRSQFEGVLISFARVLTSSHWEPLCSVHLPDVLRQYETTVDELDKIVNRKRYRDLVTPALVAAVEQGLAIIELPTVLDSHRNAVDLSAQIARIKDGVGKLKVNMNKYQAPDIVIDGPDSSLGSADLEASD